MRAGGPLQPASSSGPFTLRPCRGQPKAGRIPGFCGRRNLEILRNLLRIAALPNRTVSLVLDLWPGLRLPARALVARTRLAPALHACPCLAGQRHGRPDLRSRPCRSRSSLAEREPFHGLMLSDIGCEAPSIPAHDLMCSATTFPISPLWRPGWPDDLARVYARKNAAGQEVDLTCPPRETDCIAQRDACTDQACLCGALIQHTSASLGGTSPCRQ
jgi:hypothetical protein